MTIQSLNADELIQMMQDNPRLQIVDVRTKQEFEQLGHIPQAQLIPIHELPYAYRMIDPELTAVVVCQHGIRSMDACYFLEAQGYNDLYNLQDGMAEWTGPVETD